MGKPQSGQGGEDTKSPAGGGAGGEEGKTIEAGEWGNSGSMPGGKLVPVALM